jgi:hypothetical protein
MRQRWDAGRLLLIAWAFGVSCCGASGCTVGGRSVSIDSNSRIPFFGLELRERPRKTNGPPVHSIRSGSQTDVRIEPLGLTKAIGPPRRLGETRDRTPSPLVPVVMPLTEVNSTSASAGTRVAAEIDFR